MLYFLIGSYLLGSISSAIIICKICNLPDPRTEGSKNPGATNVLRMGGKVAAAFVLIFDGLKGAFPVFLAHYYGYNLFDSTLILLFAFLGHVFPVYYRFKGGKGVATYLGGLIAINFFVGLTFAIIWLFVAKVIKVSSIAALTATVLSPIYFYLITTHDVKATVVIFLVNLFIYFTHRENIKRIMNGEEGAIGSSK